LSCILNGCYYDLIICTCNQTVYKTQVSTRSSLIQFDSNSSGVVTDQTWSRHLLFSRLLCELMICCSECFLSSRGTWLSTSFKSGKWEYSRKWKWLQPNMHSQMCHISHRKYSWGPTRANHILDSLTHLKLLLALFFFSYSNSISNSARQKWLL